MIARYERPVSGAAGWARRCSLFAVALFAAATLLHRFGSLEVRSFVAICALAAVLAMFGVLLGAVGFAQLWARGAKGGWSSLVACMLAAIVLLPVGDAAWLFFQRPEISDISSDAAEPPQWLVDPPAGEPAMLAQAGGEKAAAYSDIVSRSYEGGIDRVLQAVRMAITDTRMTIVRQAGTHTRIPVPVAPPTVAADGSIVDLGAVHSGGIPVPRDRPSPLAVEARPPQHRTARIQALHRSMVFGLTSDVLIRLSENEETTVVDMRVASRFGPSDLGDGAKLIRRFFNDLDRNLLGVAGN